MPFKLDDLNIILFLKITEHITPIPVAAVLVSC